MYKIGLSFDIEDWFTVRNMRDFISYDQWNNQESRIQYGVDFILEQLHKRDIKATFFILGWVADSNPILVKKIHLAGHEICTHGYSHTPLDLHSRELFEKDLLRSIRSLYKITNTPIRGFRAPSFSITNQTLWAFKILKDCGIEYDSSIFSTDHPDYGIKNFPNKITRLDGVYEIPLCKCSYGGIKLPVCGGGYFRLLPYWVTKLFITSTLQVESVVMYFHPWEFDPEQPKVKLPLLKRFRHYVGLNNNKKKFIRLLDDFEFITIEKLI
jgi:polysaccharide deacetylase family protein (PEP-CTERM system associated)